tara:strand:- start:10583 stop:11284 length:702 start_codon:yes stop_codon:yes gene_type:complete
MRGVTFFLFVFFIFSSCNTNNEWIYLFDGLTTNGWRGYNLEAMPPGWIVKEGSLTFETELRLESDYKGGGNIIYVLEEFDNFELYLEWKLPDGGNSGVFYHLKEGYQDPSIVSPEYQLLDDLKWEEINNAKLEDWQKTASDYAMYSAEGPDKIIKPAGEWNSTRIIFTPKKVEHWLNGKLVVSFVPWSDDWYNRKQSGKWKNSPDYGSFKKGFIGLQDHDSPLWFREIKIKKL